MLTLEVPVPTERLLLRAFTADDLGDVQAFQADPEVVRHLYWEVRDRDASREWLAGRIAADRLAADGDGAAWAVERRADGRVVGSVNAWWRSVQHQQGEVGVVLARDAQGSGYATEAMTALLDLIFARLDLHRVSAQADPRNASSLALLARLGMRQEAHLRENEHVKGEWSDQVVWAVLRREWRARRAGAVS